MPLGGRVSPSSLALENVRALTHVCVLKVLFRTSYIGQFEHGVVSHHKNTRPLRVSFASVFEAVRAPSDGNSF
jgi:hypothetical protein